MIIFGSCNRQNLPQEFWKALQSLTPSYFLWVGDAVYSKEYTSSSLTKAFSALLEDNGYGSFSHSTFVDGVWDDHDFGLNDGGSSAPEMQERRQAFLDFVSKSNQHLNVDNWGTSTGRGLYHALNVTDGTQSIKVIFLDTRTFREDHYVPSLGQIKFPLSAIVASAFRATYSVFGFGRRFAGEVLGQEQWTWLEEQLSSSTADVHILVSSIQVLTSNPVVESWGHYPIEKRRLFDTLARVNPRNLLFLSGDVHLGEKSAAKVSYSDGSRGRWVEMTSSGLTHTCQDSLVNKALCPMMMKLFSSHRHSPNSYFLQRNFGTISVENNSLRVQVRSLEAETLLRPQLDYRMQIQAAMPPIDKVDYPDFYVLPAYLQLPLVLNLLLFLRLFFARVLWPLFVGKRKRE